MEKKIEAAYHSLQCLLADLESIRISLQRQDFYKANNCFKKDLAHLESVLLFAMEEQEYFSGAVDASKENIMFLLTSLLSALDEKEYVLLADLLSQSMLPFLYALQERIVTQELAYPLRFSEDGRRLSEDGQEFSEDGRRLSEDGQEFSKDGQAFFGNGQKLSKDGGREYQIEFTSCGLPTVKVLDGGKAFYLHSNRNVRQEAEEIAASWEDAARTEYVIYGMGLGYAVTALLERNEYAHVKVFESDAFLLELSRRYGDYERIMKSGRAEISADPLALGFFSAMAKNSAAADSVATNFAIAKEEMAIAFFYPSLRLISDHRIAERMEELFINWSSQKTQYPAMLENFKRNILHYDAPVDILKEEFCGKRVYLVAGGPSLDKNCELLKEVKNGIVVAVGTVLKKLLNQGIRPDYVAVSDAKPNTFYQVEGICEAGIPLWGLSTAYYRFFTDYHAKHYLVCQEDFEPAEKLAAEKGCFLIPTCGSVIAVAMGTAIKLGAKEIVFVGMDLAYTDGKHHAEGTGYAANQTQDERRMVPGIDGALVSTGKNLDIYRRFVEQKIAQTKGIRFVDATEGGAKIAGTEILSLAQVLKQ